MYEGLDEREDMFNRLEEMFNMEVRWDREEACIYFKGKCVCYMQLPTNDPQEAMWIVKSVIKVYQKALVKKYTCKLKY